MFTSGVIIPLIPGAGNVYYFKSGKKPHEIVDQAQQTVAQDREESDEGDLLHCVNCQHPIARKRDRITINEKHEHVCVNPHGYIYQIGCFAQAPGCYTVGQATGHFSWFPGYTWQIAICGQCLTLLGWSFRSESSRFYGLILVKLTA